MRVFVSCSAALLLAVLLACSSDVAGPGAVTAPVSGLEPAVIPSGYGYGNGAFTQDGLSQNPGRPAGFDFNLYFDAGVPQGYVTFYAWGRPTFTANGTGTIHEITFGEGGYTIYATGDGVAGGVRQMFCLKATDGSPDRFQIRYWPTHERSRNCNNPRYHFSGDVSQGNIVVYGGFAP